MEMDAAAALESVNNNKNDDEQGGATTTTSVGVTGTRTSAPLDKTNWMNLGSYLLNAVITYSLGAGGSGNAETNEYMSLKYQTLVTPASWAFSIWGLIFIAECAFVLAQMLPQYRACRLVQDGVKHNFVGACAAQILWTVAFSYEYISLSFLIMLCLCYCLMEILKAHYAMADGGRDIDAESIFTVKEYWLFRFPFELHGGWIVAASFVNFNVWLVSVNAPVWLLITCAAMSLLGVAALGLGAVWYLLRPDFTVGAVLTWAVVGIAQELRDPKQSIFNAYTYTTIDGFQMTSAVFATVLAIAVVTRGVKKVIKDRKLARDRQVADDMVRSVGGDGAVSSAGDNIASDFVKVEDDTKGGYVQV